MIRVRVRIPPKARPALEGKSRFSENFPDGTPQDRIELWKSEKESEIQRALIEAVDIKLELKAAPAEAMSFGAMAIGWEKSRDVGERTLKWYSWLLAKYVVPHFKGILSHQVTQSAVLSWMTEARQAGCSRHNLARALFVLKSVLHWGAQQSPPIVVDAAVFAIKRPKTVPTFERQFEPQVVEEIIAKLKAADLRLWALVIVAASTGMRRGEIKAMEIDWIRWQEGRIRIPAAAQKGKKERSIPLFEDLEAALRAWLAQDGDRQVGLVFPPLRNGPTGPRSRGCVSGGIDMRVALQKVREVSEIHWRGWHDFRHHYLSLLAYRGVDVRIIQELAGHTTLAQTQRYLHVAPGYLDVARAALTGSPVGPVSGPALREISFRKVVKRSADARRGT